MPSYRSDVKPPHPSMRVKWFVQCSYYANGVWVPFGPDSFDTQEEAQEDADGYSSIHAERHAEQFRANWRAL